MGHIENCVEVSILSTKVFAGLTNSYKSICRSNKCYAMSLKVINAKELTRKSVRQLILSFPAIYRMLFALTFNSCIFRK